MSQRLLPVPDGLEGLRLDVAISRLLGLSRTAAAELVDAGRVSLDGAPVPRSAKVRAGSLLELSLPEPAPASPPPAAAVAGLRVLHGDDDIVVVDKPVGVAAHPSPGLDGPTVVQGLAALGFQLPATGVAERPGIVHRLDAGTTGIMVVAKSERAYSLLKRAFKERTVEKRYSALVQGHPDPTRGTIDAPIDRHPGSAYKFAVVQSGRPSVTHYETVEAHRAATLLEIRLETGRTHQIRVHMAAIRHPCVGDLTYGADPVLARRLGLDRQWLHAHALAFTHPGSGDRVEFESPYPQDLQHALDLLRAEA
jgi:23S rRNA pseudouridine1911/1915/1917 synthase